MKLRHCDVTIFGPMIANYVRIKTVLEFERSMNVYYLFSYY